MSETNLSLYRIETELLELLQFREDTALDQTMTVAERDETLKAADQHIAEYVARELTKADNIAAFLRECDRRADLEDEEIARLQARKRKWQAWHDRLEECTIRAMQIAGKREIDGAHNTLKLRKNPASVEILQPEMIPMEYCTQTVKIQQSVWDSVMRLLEVHNQELFLRMAECGMHGHGPEPMKREISNVLKRGDGVPGCRLKDDTVRLVIE